MCVCGGYLLLYLSLETRSIVFSGTHMLMLCIDVVSYKLLPLCATSLIIMSL